MFYDYFSGFSGFNGWNRFLGINKWNRWSKKWHTKNLENNIRIISAPVLQVRNKYVQSFCTKSFFTHSDLKSTLSVLIGLHEFSWGPCVLFSFQSFNVFYTSFIHSTHTYLLLHGEGKGFPSNYQNWSYPPFPFRKKQRNDDILKT